MSRARIVCSKILSKMSPVHQYDEKSYINTSPDKEFNLCINESDVFTQNTDCNSVLGDIGTTMDDWLQPKTAACACIDANYLNDDEHFLSTKDDICSCVDIGLDLRLPKRETNLNSYCAMNEKNTDMDPLLNRMPMNELLLRKTETKCDNLLGGKDLYTSDIEILQSNRNSMWDTLSIASRRSDCDAETNGDFSDFNILSFPFETNDHIGDLDVSLNASDKNATHCDKSTSKSNGDDDKLPQSINSKKRPNILKLIKKDTETDTSVLNTTVDKNLNVDLLNNFNSDSDTVFDFPNDHAFVSSGDPEFTILHDELDCTLNFSVPNDPLIEERKVAKQKCTLGSPFAVGMTALVSNCKVNTRLKTKIVIKTNKGDKLYEGNTTELDDFRGTSKKKRLTPIEGQHVITSVKTAATFKGNKKPYETEDRRVQDMLAELGLTNDMLYILNTSLGLRMWICPEPECRRVFSRLHTLKSHIFSHYGLKPFKCDFPDCPWSFYTFFKLKRHRETHLNRKDFKCSVPDCNRTFTTIYNLNTHLKLHERPARLKCLVRTCNSKFQTRRAMEIHLKTHDVPLAPYKCLALGCNKLYFSCSALTAHARSHAHTEDELRCKWENCGRLFDKPCRLKAHMRQHTGDKPYVCKYKDCNWAFPSSSKLKRHQYKHNNERKFRCTIGDCTKAFMRSEHLRDHTFTHVAHRIFQCSICGEKCLAKGSLHLHKQKYHQIDTEKNKSTTQPTDPLVAITPETFETDSNMLTKLAQIPLTDYNVTAPKNASSCTMSLLSGVIKTVDPTPYEVNMPKTTEPYHQLITLLKVDEPSKEKEKVARKPKSNNKTASKNCARTYLPYSEISKKSDKLCDMNQNPKIAVENGDTKNDSSNILGSSKTLQRSELQRNTDEGTLYCNIMMQDDLGDDTLFEKEDGSEYILILGSGTNSSSSASTINLKDLD